MEANNKRLNDAKRNKNNEFYTRLEDIEDELQYYSEQLENKIIYCNCDNPFESNFVKYFVNNFNKLKLKKLIATCYGKQKDNAKPYKAIITYVPDGITDISSVLESGGNTLTLLDGDGNFRSSECVELLKQADIVVTNPPFSLFREYVAQLMEYQKKFLIIGNKNSVTYKDIFALIMQNRIWIGNRSMNSDFWLRVPKGQPFEKLIDGMPMKHIMGCWFTNLDVKKRHESMILTESYFEHPEKYPKYDNYDAINVDKTADIPYDYDGIMGVPTTFLDKYNSEQFELIKIDGEYKAIGNGKVNGKKVFKRIAIRNKYPCHTNL